MEGFICVVIMRRQLGICSRRVLRPLVLGFVTASSRGRSRCKFEQGSFLTRAEAVLDRGIRPSSNLGQDEYPRRDSTSER